MIELDSQLDLEAMTSTDKIFLLQSLAEFCAGYEAHMSGDNPEFISQEFREKVTATDYLLGMLIGNLRIEAEVPFFAWKEA